MTNYKNIVVWFLLLLFIPNFSYSKEKDYFEYIGFTIQQSNENHLALSYKPVIERYDTIVTQNGTMTILPYIKGASINESRPGQPTLLTVTVPIAIPDKNDFILDGYSIKKAISIPAVLAPVPHFEFKKEVQTEIYTIDDAAYTTIPQVETVQLKYAGISRNIQLAKLIIVVAKFNPLRQTTEIPGEININILFKNTSASHYSSHKSFDFVTSVLNNNVAKNWEIPEISQNNNLKKNNINHTLGLSSGNWIKLTIEKEGVYKINASDISALGFNIPPDQVKTIKIFGNGGRELSERVSDAVKNKMNEQAIIVRTDADGALNSIIFYGAPTQGFKYNGSFFESWYNHYSDKNYYLLTWGGDEGKRATPGNASGQVKNKPLTYTERIFYKEELTNALIGGSGRVWFGGSLFPRAFSNVLYNLDRTKEIFYKFNFAHRSGDNGTFSITESGKKILDVYIPLTADTKYLDARAKTGEISVDANIIPADNRSLLNINYENPKIAGSVPFFNWYEIHYSRFFIPVNNQIGFRTDPDMNGITEFSVNGFDGEITGFEVTDPANPVFVENESVTGGMFVFKYQLDSLPKRFFLSAKYDKPDLAITSFANLREDDSDAEMILITHPSFMNSAEEYKNYRSDRKIEIININDIFNEFNAGLPDPTALRDYIAYVMHNRTVKPKYIFLWGDGHYDYKNIQTKEPSYLITYQSIDDGEDYKATISYMTDDYFAQVIGDDPYCDISISRMPIQSNEEGKWMVEKIKLYEKNSALDDWTTHMMLIADDSPTSNGSGDGATHTRQSETLANQVIPPYMINKKIYLPEYPSENIPNGRRKPRVTEDIVSYANDYGCISMNWVGHGNPRVWAHEIIFDRDKTIAEFKNLNRLFFNTAATCDFARWDMPEIQSGAEMLLMAKNGGSIGEFSSTRVVYSYDNSQINQTFHFELFRRLPTTKQYPTLGEVMHAVKQIRANSNDRKYNLLTDPMIRLLIPYYIVRIDSINSQPVSNPDDTAYIDAMSKVEISASVINPVDSSVVTDFNGFANVTMLDADYNVIVEDVDGTNHKMKKYGGILNRGTFKITNGNINTSFYIPEDISFIEAPGRIYIYAISDDKRTANGFNSQFRIIGIDSNIVDADKPKIDIFLDSTNFKPGDIVSDKPMLIVNIKDKYGINTSGSGIGHRLEAWLDDNPYPIDLTNNTYISPDEADIVKARKLLTDLSPGYHKIKVRAWNVFNKYAVSETTFRVLSDKAGAMVWDFIPYPNPFVNTVNLQFRHNLSLPFEAILKIFSPNGRMVNKIDMQMSSVHTSKIQWNGTDFVGNRVAPGTYLFFLEIHTYKGDATANTGAVLIK